MYTIASEGVEAGMTVQCRLAVREEQTYYQGHSQNYLRAKLWRETMKGRLWQMSTQIHYEVDSEKS